MKNTAKLESELNPETKKKTHTHTFLCANNQKANVQNEEKKKQQQQQKTNKQTNK